MWFPGKRCREVAVHTDWVLVNLAKSKLDWRIVSVPCSCGDTVTQQGVTTGRVW